MTFKALLATKTGDSISTSLVDFNEEDLMPGNVTVAVEYSTVNYKDAMAVTGRRPVIRQFPLIPGIDFAGIVEASTYPGIAVGDRVVANGWGLSQTHHGGFAQKARVSYFVAFADPASEVLVPMCVNLIVGLDADRKSAESSAAAAIAGWASSLGARSVAPRSRKARARSAS